jgi:hypothetical protein
MNSICNDNNCSQYLHDLIDVIYNHMICLDSKDRLESKDLLEKIKPIEENRKIHNAYWKNGCARKISWYHDPSPIQTQYKAGFGSGMPIYGN